MYNKKPWNKGLHYEFVKRQGVPLTEEHKNKIRDAHDRGCYIGKGMTGKKHSKESKQKMREATLHNIKKGVFKQARSAPHIKFSIILDELKVKYKEEKIVGYWSFDFYLTEYNLYIEVDGDYFHSNPKVFPNGPKTKTQKVNFYRDKKKNQYCTDNNLKLVRFWEFDILNKPETVKCKLQKLLELNL